MFLPPPLLELDILGLVSSSILAQQHIARWSLCSINELEQLIFPEFSHATFQLRELKSKLKQWWWATGREIEPTLNTRSISSLVAFRNPSSNDLTELPPDIFDSLTLLTRLYVLSLVMETSFVAPSPSP